MKEFIKKIKKETVEPVWDNIPECRSDSEYHDAKYTYEAVYKYNNKYYMFEIDGGYGNDHYITDVKILGEVQEQVVKRTIWVLINR